MGCFGFFLSGEDLHGSFCASVNTPRYTAGYRRLRRRGDGAQARPTSPAYRTVRTSIDGERVGASSSRLVGARTPRDTRPEPAISFFWETTREVGGEWRCERGMGERRPKKEGWEWGMVPHNCMTPTHDCGSGRLAARPVDSSHLTTPSLFSQASNPPPPQEV